MKADRPSLGKSEGLLFCLQLSAIAGPVQVPPGVESFEGFCGGWHVFDAELPTEDLKGHGQGGAESLTTSEGFGNGRHVFIPDLPTDDLKALEQGGVSPKL